MAGAKDFFFSRHPLLGSRAINRVNRRWQQILACSLALCFALAGTVAIHPALHRWVEHGGAGHEHNHLGASHSHPHPHVPSVPFEARQSLRSPADANALTLFGLQPQDIYRAIARIFTRASLPGNPPDSDSEHTHHSLPQLLASGLVEGAVEIAPLILQHEPLVCFLSVTESRAGVVELFAPTAGRGPPVFC